ncbi:MAG: flagellar hook-associated protein FlgK [Acidaminobacteraceae bacterium]
MASTFFGLNIARSGLFASQQALQVTSHNIANANTEGYTRQRVDMHAFRPDQLPGVKGTLGVGVDTDPVKQIRNEYLDYTFRAENSTLKEWESREDILLNIEAIFNEPSDSGVTKLMDEYYSSLQELNKNPESLTTRALVRQRGIALTQGINGIYTRLSNLQEDSNFELKVAVNEINGYAKEISKLNKVIFESELEGGRANDVRDQRNLLVDKLSGITEVNYYEETTANGGTKFHISVSGHELVNHVNYDELELIDRDVRKNDVDSPDLKDIRWASGATFSTNSGKLKGILDMRDSVAAENKGIPYYMQELNEFVDTMTTEMNMIHAQGFDLKKGTGVNMFTVSNQTTEEYNSNLKSTGLNGGEALDVTSVVNDGVASESTYEEKLDKIHENMNKFKLDNPEYKEKSIKYIDGRYYVTDRIVASNLTISNDIDADLNKLASSTIAEGVPGNGSNALRIADVRHNTELFDSGSPDDFMKSLISNLGVDTQEAMRVRSNQDTMIKEVVKNKESVSGVSLDEEMSMMVQFQHSYNANARMLTTVDGILDTIINRLGLVGR